MFRRRKIEPPPPDVFERNIGSFGCWHVMIIVLIYLNKFPVGWHQLNIIIISHPGKVLCANNVSNPCSAQCVNRSFDPAPFTNTIQSEWNLICGDFYIANLAQMFVMVGILIGNGLWGLLADKFGRKWLLIGAVVLQCVSGTAMAFIPWLPVFLLLRFLVATATGGMMSTGFVLLMEATSRKWRVLVATFYQVPTWLAHLTLAGIGYVLPNWRHSELAISAYSFILFTYICFIPESPRWLVANGDLERAVKVMTHAARMNGQPTEQITKEVNEFVATREVKQVGRCADLFSTKVMCFRTFALIVNWIAVGFCFYGVAQFAGMMAGNVFANIAISASVELPSALICLPLLNYFGRKWTIIGACIFSGTPMLLLPFLPEDSIIRVILAMFSLCGLALYFTAIYIHSGELYPTVIRTQGVGLTAMCCRFGTIVAPFVSTLIIYDFGKWITPFAFGIAPLIACVFMFFLPETKDAPLPETVEDAIAIGKKKADE